MRVIEGTEIEVPIDSMEGLKKAAWLVIYTGSQHIL